MVSKQEPWTPAKTIILLSIAVIKGNHLTLVLRNQAIQSLSGIRNKLYKMMTVKSNGLTLRQRQRINELYKK